MNWVWFNLSKKKTPNEWEKTFQFWRDHGVSGLLPNIYNSKKAFYHSKYLNVQKAALEQILPLAKKFEFEVHGWVWTMPNNDGQFAAKFPEAFVVNRRGESARTKPAYVKHYKFLCPNRPETQEHIQKIVTELAQIELLDGIHLDYIRYPDVILPIALQSKYDIIQDKEFPQFDYCYCETCRSKFKQQAGIDPLEIEDPANHAKWNQFRYDSISRIVNEIVIPIAKKFGKKTSAAVFPNWRNVRQEWRHWDLDYFFPMLYHKFYNEDVFWIGEQIKKEMSFLKSGQKLFGGLLAKSLKPDELKQALQISLDNGARGISLFTGFSMSESHWEILSENSRQ